MSGNVPDLRELLADAQRIMVETLLDKLKSGEITHQELAILQKELRANGLRVAADADDNTPTRPVDLPDFDDDDQDED